MSITYTFFYLYTGLLFNWLPPGPVPYRTGNSWDGFLSYRGLPDNLTKHISALTHISADIPLATRARVIVWRDLIYNSL